MMPQHHFEPGAVRPTPLLPPFWLLAAVLAMVGLDRLAPLGRLPSAGALRGIGLTLLVGALATNVWLALKLKRRGTTVIPFREPTQLVTDGPFALSRNPIYASMAVALAGVATALGSLSPWLVLPGFVWWIDRRFVRQEEAMLAAAFGDRYEAYRGRVRRWL